MLQADKANPRDSVTFYELRPESFRQMRLNDFRRDSVIQEKATSDYSFDREDFHRALLADEVEDEDVVEDGLEDFDESLMVIVGKVNVETGAVLEGYDKTMRETFGAVFGADVGAPLEVDDGMDLSFEGGKFLLDIFDLLGFGFFFEFEADDMTEESGCFFFSGWNFFVVIGHSESWNEGGKGNDDFLHGATV